jgi:hypothetical protein
MKIRRLQAEKLVKSEGGDLATQFPSRETYKI